MTIDDGRLKDILLKEDYVTEADIKKAEKWREEHHGPLSEYLISEGIVTKSLLGQAIAESFNVPFADLRVAFPPKTDVLRIPEEVAKERRAVFFKEESDHVVVATDDPGRDDLRATLTPLFPEQEIRFAYALPEDLEAAFVHYRKPLATRFAKIIESQAHIAPEILAEIFEDARVFRASDIHFEPQVQAVIVRFRIDGVLHEAGRLPTEHYENVLNRVKVEARLRLDEHFAAQDGSMRYAANGQVTDMRISVVPTIEGETIVIRMLAEYVRAFGLTDLGLTPLHQSALDQAARKPYGLILITGPTGSGKTTTLYAVVKTLNRPEVNVTTIEDPVEYRIEGVNQIQVNLQTNLTFAQGLRSIVRQDPDVILIGEVRDRETAEIAVNAALTGHLVLSSFHANDAATALPRLLDMGVEPFLLASTMNVVAAQRLVRRICEKCRTSYTASRHHVAPFPRANRYFPEAEVTLYKGKGCEACGGTGYRGRTAIFEFIRMTPEMQALVLEHPSTAQIWSLASAQGARPLFEDGIEKVKEGVTTIEELLRVAVPPATPS